MEVLKAVIFFFSWAFRSNYILTFPAFSTGVPIAYACCQASSSESVFIRILSISLLKGEQNAHTKTEGIVGMCIGHGSPEKQNQ
jgi:hypothetical protein